MGVVTNAVIKTIFRNAMDIQTTFRAIVLMVIDGVVHQVGIVPLFEDLNCAVTVGEEAKIHHASPFNDTIIDANHLNREFWVRLAIQFKFIRAGIQFILNAGIQEVEESLFVSIPGAK